MGVAVTGTQGESLESHPWQGAADGILFLVLDVTGSRWVGDFHSCDWSHSLA